MTRIVDQREELVHGWRHGWIRPAPAPRGAAGIAGMWRVFWTGRVAQALCLDRQLSGVRAQETQASYRPFNPLAERAYEHILDPTAAIRRGDHEELAAICGIHLARSLELLPRVHSRSGSLIAECVAWGAVCEGEFGFRAQFVRIDRLILPRATLWQHHDLTDGLRDRYQVPVRVATDEELARLYIESGRFSSWGQQWQQQQPYQPRPRIES